MATLQRLGRYEITEVLGRGAMGVVYRGFDPGIRRTVAIKTIRRELLEGDRPATEMLARFRNEARAAGQLSHPGIVAVYDYGEDESVAYIAMEYIEGNSLREYFDRGTRFTERDVVSIMSQLLEALAHAHERRVWHRDIKPANLIVMMDGRVKVADFGIARIEASDLTHTGAIMGSPGYMAPEQYAAAAIDHRADIFAAGVVFYQLLTARKPFIGSNEQIAYAICHTEVQRPSLVDPARSWEQYDAIVAKALAKRPEDRFKTAEAFRAAILEAHAAPPAPTITADTIITEVLRPPGLPSEPSGPSRQPVLPSATAGPGPRARPWGALAGLGLGLAIVAATAVWFAFSRDDAPRAPAPVAVTPASPPPPAPAKPQPEQEVVFWESVRNSTNPAELQAYLARYPGGAFAALARARIEALAAAEAKRAAAPAPRSAPVVAPAAPERRPVEKPVPPPPPQALAKPDQEALFWESVRASSNPAELQAYLARYPDGAFAPLARTRLESIAAAEAKRTAEAKAAVAAAAQRPTAVAAPAADRLDGRWTALFACDAFMESKSFSLEVPTEIRSGGVHLSHGTPGQPNSWRVEGRLWDDDRLVLSGTGVAGVAAYRGQEYQARFDGRFGARGYEGEGKFGGRKCRLSMTRAGG